MILSIILYCIVQINAHELVPLVYQDDGDNKFKNEEIQLIRLFSSSRSIISDLPGVAFTATSTHANGHLPQYGRINNSDSRKKENYWAPKSAVLHDALTVDLMTSYLVTGVATQGGTRLSQWVTRYSVHTSEDGLKWISIGTFKGNFDEIHVCQVRFPKPVLARFVKFTVAGYHGHPSLKVDVLIYDQH